MDEVGRPYRHNSPAWFILLCVQLMLEGLCSSRGVSRCLHLFAQHFGIPTPCHVTILNWVLRLGGHLLTEDCPDDKLAWIVDHTVEQGKEKGLVILGVPTDQLISDGVQLRHKDVKVLHLIPQAKANGASVHEVFTETAQRFGAPAYIVSDHGSDLKKAITLYQDDHPETGAIYDITHQMAILLKTGLASDPRWKTFSSLLSQTSKEVRQTELHFLAPGALRTKSRFLNLEKTMIWAKRILAYQRREDLHETGGGYLLNEQQIQLFQIYHGTVLLCQLKQLQGQRYPRKEAFIASLTEAVGSLSEDLTATLVMAADRNRPRFMEKFGWVQTYADDVTRWSEMFGACRVAMTLVKRKGLHSQTQEDLKNVFSRFEFTTKIGEAFRDKVSENVEREASKVSEGCIWLGTSDVLESIFGKYKGFSARSPLKTLGRLMLTIPALTSHLTADKVKTAMESFSTKQLKALCKNLFGVSSLSKRRSAFGPLEKVRDLFSIEKGSI